METPLLVALVSGFISAAVAYFTTAYKFAQDRRILVEQLNQRSLEKLYSLRIERYPRAFDITEWIRRKRADQGGINSREELLKVRADLWEWKTGEVSLILSSDAIEAFYDLVTLLKKPCGDSRNNIYSPVQIDNIMTARNRFRSVLRSDIGHRHIEKWRGETD